MFLTTREVAARLRFSPETIRDMIRRGELHAVRWGRQWRVPEDALAKEAPPPPDVRKSKRARDEVARARARVGL